MINPQALIHPTTAVSPSAGAVPQKPAPGSELVVELFYVEQDGCEPCARAVAEVDVAARLVRDELAAYGRKLTVRAVALHEPGHAQALGVENPVTVRVGGTDIGSGSANHHLTECGVSGAAPRSCRSYAWEGQLFDAPPAGLIVDAVHREIDHDAPPEAPALAGLARLRHSVRGAVLVPGDPGWAQVKATFNVAVEQHPTVVVVPADAADVVTVVRFAAEHGVEVVPQRTGHNAAPLGDLSGTILLRTDAMADVHLDGERGLAVVGAGAKWADVVPAASDLGLMALHGSTPDVSVAGYTLGGGIGWYARSHGLAANSLTGVELVTPDGQLRWVDREHEPELFWALRGGGGNFGVVTALEFRLYPVPEVYAGALFFPAERASEVLKAWLTWTRTVPESVTSVGRIIRFPAELEVPELLRGGSFAVVEAVFTDDEASGSALLDPLRRLGPVMDTFKTQPPAGIAELHMDPQNPLPYAAEHVVLADVTHEAIDGLVGVVGQGSGSELISVEIRHLGGALSRAGKDHGALAKMPGEYLLFGVGATPTAAAADAVRADLALMKASLSQFTSGSYYNFSEDPTDPRRHFPPEVYARLQRIRSQVDPKAIIRANHTIRIGTTPRA